jgi:hypothetical protein
MRGEFFSPDAYQASESRGLSVSVGNALSVPVHGMTFSVDEKRTTPNNTYGAVLA